MDLYDVSKKLGVIVSNVKEAKELVVQIIECDLLGDCENADLRAMHGYLEIVCNTVGHDLRCLDGYLADLADAHDCYENASSYGICTVCGRIITDSQADHDLHGY